jgi:hypothetical protein
MLGGDRWLKKQGNKLIDEKGYEYKAYTVYIVAENKKLEFQASQFLHPSIPEFSFFPEDIGPLHL